jgi:hypothetical protein
MITVEEARGRAAMRRFVELPYFLYRSEARWPPPLIAEEKARFDRFKNLSLMELDHVHLLARDRGKPGGRVAVRVESGVGRITAYDVIDKEEVTKALMSAAREWLRELAIERFEGPEVLVDGFDAPAVYGRSWNPDHYQSDLIAAGLRRVAGSERKSWRLPAGGDVTLLPDASAKPAGSTRFADPRLLLPGLVAQPNLIEAKGSTRELIRRAKRGIWSTAVIVACHGDPSVLVPALQAAAGAAGYADVIAPWSPDPDAPPETVHATFSGRTAEG